MAREEKQSCPEKLVATRRGESNRRGPLPPLEVAGSRQGGPEQPGEYGGPCGSWWPPGEERAASRAKVLRFLPMGSVGQENS